MSMDLGTLTAYLDADTKGFESGFSRAKDAVSTFGGKVPAWMGIGTGAIVAGAALAVGALYGIGDAFDEVKDTIRADTGATGEDLDALMDVVKDVGREVPAAWGDIGQAVSDVSQRLGLSGDALKTVSSQFLELGRITGEEVDIDAATGALNAFHVEGEDVAGALDTLYQQSQRSGIGFNDLTSRLSSAAPITQQLGFTMEETAGMIASMDKAGLDSQTMIGAMQKGLIKLTKPGEEAGDAFKRVVGEIEGFMASGDKAAAMDLAGQVFGTRGAAQFIGALESGAINMGDLASSAELSGDSILGAAADTMDFAEKWQLVQNKAGAALEPLGSAVFAALGEALDFVMPALTDLGTWMEENPDAVQQVAMVLGVLAAAFVVLTIAVWAANAAFLANPVTWIILAIVALIAAIVLLVLNWDQVVAWITEVWSGFISWITEVITGFESWWRSVWEGFAGFITDVWNGFVGWITDIWNGFISWLMMVSVAMIAAWFATWAAVGTFFSDLWNGIVTFATDAWNGLMAFLGSIPQGIMDLFAGAGEWLYDIGADILQGLWDGLLSIWNGLVSWVEDIGQGIADTFAGILGIHSPSRVFRSYGEDTIKGYIEGVDAMRGPLDDTMLGIAPTPEMSMASSAAPGGPLTPVQGTRVVNYYAAENQSLSAEEALFNALGSPRVKEEAA